MYYTSFINKETRYIVDGILTQDTISLIVNNCHASYRNAYKNIRGGFVFNNLDTLYQDLELFNYIVEHKSLPKQKSKNKKIVKINKTITKPTTTLFGTQLFKDQQDVVDFIYNAIQRISDIELIKKEISCAINAYAGTGKTTLMAVLIKYLKKVGFNIIALSFTNKAVNEIKEAADVDGVNYTTISAFAHDKLKNNFPTWKSSSGSKGFESFEEYFQKADEFADANEKKIYYCMLHNDIHVEPSAFSGKSVNKLFFNLYNGYVKKLILYKNIGFKYDFVTGKVIVNYDDSETYRNASMVFYKHQELSKLLEKANMFNEDGITISEDEVISTGLEILKLFDNFHNTIYPSGKVGVKAYVRKLFMVDEYPRQVIMNNILTNENYDIIILDEHQDSNEAHGLMIDILRHKNQSAILAIFNFEQEIFRYNGSNSASHAKSLWDKLKTFTLKTNVRSNEYEGLLHCKLLNLRLGKDIIFFNKTFVKPYNERIDINESINIAKNGDAFITRTNNQLFSIALKLISIGKKVSYVNDKFFSKLESSVNAFKKTGKNTVKDILKNILDTLQSLEAKHNKTKEDSFQIYYLDKLIKEFSDFILAFGSIDELRNMNIVKLFTLANEYLTPNQEDGVIVTTAHASKGRTFKSVFVINDVNYDINNQNIDIREQELFLLYVAISRNKERRYFVELADDIVISEIVSKVDKTEENFNTEIKQKKSQIKIEKSKRNLFGGLI